MMAAVRQSWRSLDGTASVTRVTVVRVKRFEFRCGNAGRFLTGRGDGLLRSRSCWWWYCDWRRTEERSDRDVCGGSYVRKRKVTVKIVVTYD